MTYFSNNLKYLRDKHGVDQEELAIRLGRKSGSSVSEWEAGNHQPRSGTLSEIAKYFHVTLSELMETDLTSGYPTYIADDRIINVPLIEEVKLGTELFYEGNIKMIKPRLLDSLPSGDLFYTIAKNDHMYPVIKEETFILCRVQNTLEVGKIVAVVLYGETEIKIKMVNETENGEIFLQPANPKYRPVLITENKPVRVLGTAIEATTIL